MNLYTIYQIFKILALSLSYLHDRNLVYGDICPENIIIIENNSPSNTDIDMNPNYKLICAKLVGLNRAREIKID